ncbi:MAG: hypothetical protein K2K19_04410 [Acetatifactor sp.]|nr:hypothetical protein [Acetatifactor sp.]
MTEEKRRNNGKPILSLWALLARCSIYKILTVLAAMALAEVLLFYRCRRTGGGYTLEGAVMSSHLSVVFMATLGLVCFVLAWTQGRLDARSSATMLRLQLSGSRIFMIKTVYNVVCIMMLFMAQIWLGIWLVRVYGREMEEIYALPQRLFLAFYRIDFLHCLLPMAEIGKWVRNLLLLLALGTEAAGAKKKNYIPLFALLALNVNSFVSSMGVNVIDLICCLTYIVVITANIWQVRKAQREEGM